MKIVAIRKLQDCFDGSFIKEALLDTAVSKEFIDFLGLQGELEYYGSFARPFYKITVAHKYILKGVEGNSTIRLILNRGGVETAEEAFVVTVNGYEEKFG